MQNSEIFSGGEDARSDSGPGLSQRVWLAPGDDFLRLFLRRPELAPVAESCAAERELHDALSAVPSRPVSAAQLQAIEDADARENYALFLRFRDALLAAGTLEAYYLGLFPRTPGRQAVPITIAPLFIDMIVGAIAENILKDSADAYQLRAADMLHQSQRVTVHEGQVLAGDQHLLDMLNDTGGVGDIGRFLVEAGAPLAAIELRVLTDGNAPEFFAARQGSARQRFLLDLTHEVKNDLSHGLVLTMTRARSGLKALAGVLQLWVRHFLGVAVTIRPLQKIDDDAWRWHLGLDAEASALLDDLYLGREVEPARLRRLVSLFRLDFADAGEMRTDIAGKPVYLGLMMNSDGVMKIKPQNLLINLPLRSLS